MRMRIGFFVSPTGNANQKNRNSPLATLQLATLLLISAGVPHERALTNGNENLNHRFHRFTQIFLFFAFSASLWFVIFVGVPLSGALTKKNENLSTDFTDLHRFFFSLRSLRLCGSLFS